MFVDMEEHVVELTGKPNGSVLIIGKSGYGKTYCSYRMIEENMSKGLRQVILDASGSYSKEELIKNKLRAGDSLEIVDLSKAGNKFCLRFPVSDPRQLVEVCVSALAEALDITSAPQLHVLRVVIKTVLRVNKQVDLFNIAQLLKALYESCEMEQNFSVKRDVELLLNRMHKFNEVYASFSIVPEDPELLDPLDTKSKSVLLQLSDFIEGPREQMTAFILAILWRAACHSHGNPPFDIIVMDEIQHIPIANGSTLNAILREGRKYGISALLTTQYLGDYDKGRTSALLQVGAIVIFHPVLNDIDHVNKILQEDTPVDVKPTLHTLKNGVAILKGEYKVKGAALSGTRPVIVNIRSMTGNENAPALPVKPG